MNLVEHTRKLLNIIKEAAEVAITQEQLAKMYPTAKPMQFIKNIPVALVPFTQLEKYVGPDKAKEIEQIAGAVDKTSYDDAFKSGAYVVFQWNSKENKPDFYFADPNSVKAEYTKFTGQLPTDPNGRSKVPSLVVLDNLGIDASRIPMFVKIVPTQMVSADELGLAGKKIQTRWGEPTVQQGGFLVREYDGHIYTVAPDANGLPIGYVSV
jgi:hypothetical protein